MCHTVFLLFPLEEIDATKFLGPVGGDFLRKQPLDAQPSRRVEDEGEWAASVKRQRSFQRPGSDGGPQSALSALGRVLVDDST